MNRRYQLAAVLSLAALALVGCEDASHKPVQSRPAALARPAVHPQTSSPMDLGGLPIKGPSASKLVSLSPQPQVGIDFLISSVEEKFRSGEQEYHAGHLEKARRDFDQAIDWLLQSGYDLDSDPRLQQVFERIVDTVYSEELQAFREGDGFAEPPAVPAPIDELAEMTFPVDPRLKDRAELAARSVSHDLPLTVNDTVLGFLNFFQTPHGRAIVETGLRRSGRYREMIARVLREEGLPQDLMYLAQAESAFQPLALSRAGARGIWQFMAYRGHEYGLQRTWWVDERQDPEKATRAAAHHLRDLYDEFGDWYLVMAAYNCGPGNVQKGIERTGYADFWELYKRNVLPKETKNYVPIIIALTLIAKDAAHYGIRVEPEEPVPSDVVKPGRPIDLRLVAETIDADVETLRTLNPELVRLVTPADPSFELRLPKGTAARFSSEIAVIPPEKWVSWRKHRVEPGDTLVAIARRYRVTPVAIVEANELNRSEPLAVGQKLIIPAAQSDQGPGRLVRYRVRRGDTLVGVAERFNVDADELRRWNRLPSNRVRRGMVLRVYAGGYGPRPIKKAPATGSKKPKKAAATAGLQGSTPDASARR
ncbi:MAG: transglycosylase SLT domain-containing protein [Candidatus Acidiferrales bacterium]